MSDDWIIISTWAMNFARSLNSRPRLCQWIAGIMMGKYARNELRGLFTALAKAGCGPYYEYDLRHMDYHKEATK
jgi:hypothetical protein